MLLIYSISYTILIACILAPMSVYDIKQQKIKNVWLLGLLLVKSCYILCTWSVSIFCDALFGFLIISLTILPFCLTSLNVGPGDYKLIAVSGYCVGYYALPFMMVVSLIMIIAFVVVKQRKGMTIPLAPFISIGVFLSCVMDCIKNI